MTRLQLLAGIAVLSFAGAAQAGDTYVSITGSGVFLQDSDNEGAFSTDFSTGAGTAIPAGTVLPGGTPVGWNTEFDTGFAVSGAIGKRFGAARVTVSRQRFRF
ncbi:MAG: hypothetical protein AAGB02_03720 [Pseudomonadota bacterium]